MRNPHYVRYIKNGETRTEFATTLAQLQAHVVCVTEDPNLELVEVHVSPDHN